MDDHEYAPPDVQQQIPADWEEWELLALRYLDGDNSEELLRKVRILLAQRPFRRLLAVHSADAANLYEFCGRIETCLPKELETEADGLHAPSPPGVCPGESTAASAPPTVGRIATWGLLAASLAASLLVASIVYRIDSAGRDVDSQRAENRSPAALCSIDELVGDVFVGRQSAVNRHGLHEDEVIRTVGALSSVRLKFSDRTEVQLAGDASARLQERNGQKHVYLEYGHAAASVRSQPADRPLMLHTPTAEMEVVGTEFSVTSQVDATELSVSEGLVLMKPKSGGQAVAVREGETGESRLARILPPYQTVAAPGAWSQNFDNGLPPGWAQGQWRPGSSEQPPSGVVLASPTPLGSQDSTSSERREPEYAVRSEARWSSGLVRVQDDTQVTYRIKMDRPEWYQVFLCVRAEPIRDEFWSWNYEYQESLNWREVEPSGWRTVTIPANQFKRTRKLREPAEYAPFPERGGAPPPVGGLVAFVMITSAKEDRGMVIDDIRIGPPPTVNNTQSPDPASNLQTVKP